MDFSLMLSYVKQHLNIYDNIDINYYNKLEKAIQTYDINKINSIYREFLNIFISNNMDCIHINKSKNNNFFNNIEINKKNLKSKTYNNIMNIISKDKNINSFQTISYIALTPYLINLIIENILQYKNKLNLDKINLVDFGCGSGVLAQILSEELIDKNINIIPYDKYIYHNEYNNNIQTDMSYILNNLTSNDILLISWGHKIDGYLINNGTTNDLKYHEDLNKIVNICNPKLIIVIGDEPDRATLPYNYFFEKSIEYITYLTLDRSCQWLPKSDDEKIAFNLMH